GDAGRSLRMTPRQGPRRDLAVAKWGPVGAWGPVAGLTVLDKIDRAEFAGRNRNRIDSLQSNADWNTCWPADYPFVNPVSRPSGLPRFHPEALVVPPGDDRVRIRRQTLCT